MGKIEIKRRDEEIGPQNISVENSNKRTTFHCLDFLEYSKEDIND